MVPPSHKINSMRPGCSSHQRRWSRGWKARRYCCLCLFVRSEMRLAYMEEAAPPAVQEEGSVTSLAQCSERCSTLSSSCVEAGRAEAGTRTFPAGNVSREVAFGACWVGGCKGPLLPGGGSVSISSISVSCRVFLGGGV